MRFFDQGQIQPIGLDIGDDQIVRMIQLERQGERLSVVAAARGVAAKLPNGSYDWAAIASTVRELLRQRPFRGRRVVAALPREAVCVRPLRLPPLPADYLAAAVKSEIAAGGVLPFDARSARIQFLPVGESREAGETRTEVIVLAARNADVQRLIGAFEGAGGLELAALDVEPCALYRTVERFVRRKDDLPEVHALLEVGHARSQVVIGRGRQIQVIKPVGIGGSRFDEAVSQRLGLSLAEARGLRRRFAELEAAAAGGDRGSERDRVRQSAGDAVRAVMEELGREVAICLRYHAVTFRGPKPRSVRVLGTEASDAQLLAILNKALPVPAEVGKPLYSVDTSRMDPSDRGESMAEWAMALGLGLKCVEATFGPRDGRPRQIETGGAGTAGDPQGAEMPAAGLAVSDAPQSVSL